jgi:CBS domain-containing protein/sporulation protein YlmC with PRC-barrel domain
MAGFVLTELLGAPVVDASGAVSGRLREVAIAPQEDQSRIAAFVIKTKSGDRLVPFNAISSIRGGLRTASRAADWTPLNGTEGLLFLERDLLDQQVIDVHGRKVVRVNDIDLYQGEGEAQTTLKVSGVDVGARGAIRRLLRGLVPGVALHTLLRRIPPRSIPWEFVDLIETDPARRVKLKISHDRLAQLHPADIADIVEDLAPAEREAVFETLDEEVAAEALEEVEPKLQKSIVESLDADRAADIVEEMNPDAAADLLGELPEERTEEILQEMGPTERQDMVELLEFEEDSAAGRMNTDYLALPFSATVHDAIESLRAHEGGVETISTIFLTDSHGTLVGSVPLSKIVLAKPEDPMLSLASEPLISCHADTPDAEVAELFDKYNLLMLPVVDEERQLVGAITSDDVISVLRSKL